MPIQIVKGPTGRILGLRHLLQGIARQDVEAVITEFGMELAARHAYKDSTDYDLVHEERTYPPKAIFGLAAERILGRPLAPDEFTGGEKSPAFSMLRDLGFLIQRKASNQTSKQIAAVPLTRFNRYSREAIASIFDPDYEFKPSTGSWGISGIVEVPSDSGDFVFMVTLGKAHPGNPYQDALTQDGYLIWESQTRHSFQSPTIKKLIAHDSEVNNIHLFLRSSASQDYAYMGLLDYSSHDENKQNPVHFVWKIRSWDLVDQDLNKLSLDFRPAIDPAYSPQATGASNVLLTEVERPKPTRTLGRRRQSKRAGGGDIDWAARDAKNRRLGLAGEMLVIAHETALLKAANRPDLAKDVVHVALTDSTAGYDVRSFWPDGRLKRIEVKTTEGADQTPFYISINEVLASREDPESYLIYRVFGFDRASTKVSFYTLHGDVEETCDLYAVSFRARPLPENRAD